MADLRPKAGLWSRIKRLALTDVGALVRGLKGDELEQMERMLLEADFGVPATLELVEFLDTEIRRGKVKTDSDLRQAFGVRLATVLSGPEFPERIFTAPLKPTVILVVGVNGVGKTTTVAKLAHRLTQEGRKVVLGAADTWRAGAVAQLETWAERLQLECVSGTAGGDPAAVAFDAVQAGIARGADVVLIDTAGRLHTQDNLMTELGKVVRVIDRKLPGAPHEVLLVIDGTVGQNAVQQGKQFAAVVKPTGLIVTKLDGSARGGAVVALRRELDVPIRFIGTGESVDDLKPFRAQAWAAELLDDAG
jgi:fused signal recognition particle receptor